MGACPHVAQAPRPRIGGPATPAPTPARGPAWGYPHSREWVAEWARGRYAAVMLGLCAMPFACVNVVNLNHTQP